MALKLSRRHFTLGASALFLSGAMPTAPLSAPALAAPPSLSDHNISSRRLDMIAFGSCARQDMDQPVWDSIAALEPDLFVFLGDTVYADTENMDKMAADYELLGKKPGFQALRRGTPVIGIWDDHDYGVNDGDKHYVMKQDARNIFLDFFEEPANSPRRTRKGGIYTSYLFGPAGQRVHIILPDLRYERDRLPYGYTKEEFHKRVKMGYGPYRPLSDPSTRLMSETQWQWLEQELRRPAEIKIIGSSIQFVAATSGWEGWAQFPHERARLIRLINTTGAQSVFFISGDIHRGEFSLLPATKTGNIPTPAYPLWDFTSSGLKASVYPGINPNHRRFNNLYYDRENFGLIYIDWGLEDPQITAEIRNEDGQMVLQHSFRLNLLQHTSSKTKG